MNTLAAFEIIGIPTPKGSKTRMPNGALVEGSSTAGRERRRTWGTAVTDAARAVADDEPYDGNLAVTVAFRFPMPASRPRWMKTIGEHPKTTKPDIDKIVRELLDGFTAAGLIRDDARIFHIDAAKFEVVGWTGAEVTLRRWEA